MYLYLKKPFETVKKCAGVRIDRILRDKRTRQPDPNTVPLTSTLYPTYSNKILLLLTVIFSFILGTSLVFFVELFSSQPFISNTHLHCKLYIFSGYFPSIKRHTCSTQNKKRKWRQKLPAPAIAIFTTRWPSSNTKTLTRLPFFESWNMIWSSN